MTATERTFTPKPLLINGAWHTTAATLSSHNPATQELLGSVCVAGEPEVALAVESAHHALAPWRNLGERGRQAALERFRAAIAAAAPDIARLITAEQGKPQTEALTSDVTVALDALRHYVRHGLRDLPSESVKPSNPVLRGTRITLVHEPAGVVAIIAPWNIPFGIPVSQIATALIVGNTVVLKPSEWTPLIAHRIAAAAHAAGLPPGVLNVVHGDGRVGGLLIRQPQVRRVLFTGSVATGKKVAVACAERLCPVTLELGGVGPALVLGDADPDLAARGVVWTRFINCGQACVAAERVYVNQAIATPFIAAVRRHAAALRVGAGTEAVDVGPLINSDGIERIERHIANAVQHGAVVETGGMRLSALGPQFFAPTVLSGVTDDMLVMQEETFGPLLPISVVPDDASAVAAANALPLGLGATIWTKDTVHGERIARQIETGMVWVNDSVVFYADPVIPWGGVKESGIGRTHGRAGLLTMVDTKVIAIAQHKARLWWFPYLPRMTSAMQALQAVQHQTGWRAKLRGAMLAWRRS